MKIHSLAVSNCLNRKRNHGEISSPSKMSFHFKKDFEFCYWQALFVVVLILITSTSLRYTVTFV